MTINNEIPFTRATGGIRARIICAIDAKGKEGKSHLSLTAARCGPLLYQDIDIGSEGMIDKFLSAPSGANIYHERYQLYKDVRDSKDLVKSKVMPVFNKWADDYYKALKSSLSKGGIRNIIWDTGTDFWKLVQNAYQGKDVKLMPEERTTINAIFSGMVRAAFAHNANLIILHQLSPTFDNPNVMERKHAHNQTENLIEVAFESVKVKKRDGSRLWEYKVSMCRQDTTKEGETFEGGGYDGDGGVVKGTTFAQLAAFARGMELVEWKKRLEDGK